MANKKYKLTDGNYWATDGIHDFGQNKTQREINAALVQADSDLSGAITSIGTRATVTAPTLTDSWLGSANDGEYQITGGSLSGTFIEGADNAYGVLTIGRSNTYGYIFYHTDTALYRRRFGRNGTTITWAPKGLERIDAKIVRYSNVTLSSSITNGQLARVPSSGTDAKLTEDSTVLEVVFSNPAAILSDITVNKYAGYFTLVGTTAASAGTVDIKMGNP